VLLTDEIWAKCNCVKILKIILSIEIPQTLLMEKCASSIVYISKNLCNPACACSTFFQEMEFSGLTSGLCDTSSRALSCKCKGCLALANCTSFRKMAASVHRKNTEVEIWRQLKILMQERIKLVKNLLDSKIVILRWET
jgi:hypothetical protein